MEIFIDYHSGMPIYQQIERQIRNQIVSGRLKRETPLPSIRNLAKDLRVSVITTKRAYEELERSGFIYTVQGKGCFVSGQSVEAVRESHLREIETHLKKASELAQSSGMEPDELRRLLNFILEEEQ